MFRVPDLRVADLALRLRPDIQLEIRSLRKVANLYLNRLLACVVSGFLASPTAMPQQSPPAASATAPAVAPVAAPAAPLKILVLQGEGAKNNLKVRKAVAPVVEVRDEKDKPVAGAEVDFQLPMVGPGGSFSGWLRMQTTKTDAEGKATTTGYLPNEEEGRFNIKVTARASGSTGSAVISQANVWNVSSDGVAKKKRSGWWVVAAIVGGAALGGGILAATRGDDTAATTPTVPVTVTIGSVSVGTPR